jgi:hypothetical protein
MNRLKLNSCLPAMALAGSIFMGASPAAADTTSYIDLTAGLGYSTNPFDRIPGESSAFGRLSAFGLQAWHSERGTTSLSGYVEDTTYFKNYGSRQIFSLNAHTDQAVSPKVRLFGDLSVSGDFAGQLSNRLITVPSQPPVPEPGNPLPPPNTNPDVFGLTGRQYTITGQVGASISTSAKGALSLSAGAERLIFTGTNAPPDYNVYFGSLGYTHQISERTTLGGALYLQRQDFSSGDYANVVDPSLTIRSQLTETLTADGAVGLMIIDDHHSGIKHTSTTPSFSAGLCSTTETSRICGHVSRDAQSSVGTPIGNRVGESAVSTRVSASYYRRLSEASTLQASLSGVRYSTTQSVNGSNFHTSYISAVLGYDHKVGHRLAAGVSGGLRKLYQPGPDPRTDLNAQVYLRYRLGDLL